MGGDLKDFKSFANVPIVGQAKVFEWRPIVLCQCSCGKGEPMLITSTDKAVPCSGCGKIYALGALHYHVDEGTGASIGIMEVRPPAGSNGHQRM